VSSLYINKQDSKNFAQSLPKLKVRKDVFEAYTKLKGDTEQAVAKPVEGQSDGHD
jgi:hypothetical protein